MHKKELIRTIAASTKGSIDDYITKDDIEQIVDAFCENVTQSLVGGEKVQLVGFGAFDVSLRTPTNPQTGTKMEERQVPTFKASADLKERVKDGTV